MMVEVLRAGSYGDVPGLPRQLVEIGRYAYRRRNLLAAYGMDLCNRLLYGPVAPRHAERIWIDPADCHKALRKLRRSESGKVIEGAWPPPHDKTAVPIGSLPKFRFCIAHWVDGVSWENTGAYHHMQKLIDRKDRKREPDGCRSLDDVVRRYRALDRIFDEIRSEGRFKTRQEISYSYFRESDGVYAHIGANGETYLGAGGVHRFAIAVILGLRRIPAQLGCIHVSALPRLPDLRHESA